MRMPATDGSGARKLATFFHSCRRRSRAGAPAALRDVLAASLRVLVAMAMGAATDEIEFTELAPPCPGSCPTDTFIGAADCSVLFWC